MSEEEIKILKVLINNKDVFYYEDDFNNRIRPLVGKLLDLYNKEKEQNEMLINEKNIYKDLTKQAQEDVTIWKNLYKQEKEKNKELEIKANELNGLAEVVERDYIHKDKIKEKIEELKNIKNAESIERVEEDISLLEELLEDLIYG